MRRILIVGSGASGVHFALSVLRKGYDVVMVDVGSAASPAVHPDSAFADLRERLEDPAAYFLGERFEAVLFPETKREYYGFPPSKAHLFRSPPAHLVDASGFEPLFSFARGGLAEAWTGGVYPLNDEELEPFPFGCADLEPYYNEVAQRIGISGVKDDLSRFMPFHEHLLEPLRLDEHSERLLSAYERQKEGLNGRLGYYMGRSRVATLSADREGRKACSYLGRCLWGCPSGALYTPSHTLEECRRYPSFTYVPGRFVRHFRYDADRRITTVTTESVLGGPPADFTADTFVLAAGTLSSSDIYLRSIYAATGEIVVLPGLMDNRQILMPFVTLAQIGRAPDTTNYQYHQVAFGIQGERSADYVHGQITTLKSGLAHPIIQNMPVALRDAVFIFRNLRAAFGVANVNLSDRRREDNYVTLRPVVGTEDATLMIRYSPPLREAEVIRRAMRTVRRALWKLGAIAPSGLAHVRPMGASVHYAGTIPMAPATSPHTVSRDCRSRYFENLYLVDGTTFPALPAKNLTFTLMANAVRVAEEAF